MNRIIVKNLIIRSLILGLIFGLIASIPKVGVIGLFGLIILTAPMVMVYSIMEGNFDLTDIKNSIISGAITGFSSNFTFCIGYSVLSALIYTGFNYSTNFILSSMIINAPIWLLVVCILFLGVLTATTNAFSGFLTYYIINFIRDSYENKHKM